MLPFSIEITISFFFYIFDDDFSSLWSDHSWRPSKVWKKRTDSIFFHHFLLLQIMQKHSRKWFSTAAQWLPESSVRLMQTWKLHFMDRNPIIHFFFAKVPPSSLFRGGRYRWRSSATMMRWVLRSLNKMYEMRRKIATHFVQRNSPPASTRRRTILWTDFSTRLWWE